MKTLYTLSTKLTLVLFLLIGSVYQVEAQCSFTVLATDTILCPGDSTTLTVLPPPTSVSTTFAGGNNHRGNMFDIVALNTVTITGFDAHPQGNTTVEIYYKTGTFVGSEANAAAWTLVGSAPVIAQPLGTPTPIPVNVNVSIPAGQTYAFYVTSNNTSISLNYTDGTALGNVYASDGNIQFLEGSGIGYPFTGGGGPFTPRVFNGNIHYSIPGGATTYAWNNGATTPSITVAPTDTTDYIVDVNISGCAVVADTTTIYVIDPPVVDLGADVTICNGDTAPLDAGNPGSTYLWSNAATTQTINATLDGTYYADVTNAGGCSTADTVIVNYHATSLNLGPDTSVCGPLALDAGNPGGTYLWSDGSTSQTFTATSSGQYSVDVVDLNGCNITDDIFVLLSPLPTIDLGADYQICVYHTTTLDAGSAVSYLWSTGATTQTIDVDGAVLGAGTHTFTVLITDGNGCTNSDDIVVTVDACVGISEITQALPMSIYPNPANSRATLELDINKAGYTRIVLINAIGQEVNVVADGALPTGNQLFDVNLSELEAGVYFVQVATADGKRYNRKVIKE